MIIGHFPLPKRLPDVAQVLSKSFPNVVQMAPFGIVGFIPPPRMRVPGVIRGGELDNWEPRKLRMTDFVASTGCPNFSLWCPRHLPHGRGVWGKCPANVSSYVCGEMGPLEGPKRTPMTAKTATKGRQRGDNVPPEGRGGGVFSGPRKNTPPPPNWIPWEAQMGPRWHQMVPKMASKIQFPE